MAKRLTNLLTLAASLFLAAAAPPAANAADRRPNIVLIVGDDMGYGDVGAYGCRDIPTPNIDSIARDGVRCSSGYVTGPVCSPTRAALLTARYQQRFGHEFNPGVPMQAGDKIGLSPDETTMADRLKAAGYVTGMVGKWHLGHAPRFNPTRRGFDEFYGFLGGAHSYQPGELQGQQAEALRSGIFRGTRPVEPTEYLTDAFGREAVAFVDRHKSAPFFLYLPFNAVHTPLQAPQSYRDRFRHIKHERRRTYAAMMSAMDDAVGRVLAKLRKEGLEENTLVFFISDNGGPLANASSNGPLRGHKSTTWEGGIRVPFMVQWKGHLPAGTVYDRPVAQIDILPTALAAAGVAVDPAWKLDGVDLMPFLGGSSAAAPHEALFWRYGRQHAVRMGDWKLVSGAVAGQAGNAKLPPVTGWKLFNLSSDVGERNDMADQEPEKVRELQAAWEKWNETLVPPAWTPILRENKALKRRHR